MFKLKFKINKIYLYLRSLERFKCIDKTGKKLESRLWKKSEGPYYILTGTYYNWFIKSISLKNNVGVFCFNTDLVVGVLESGFLYSCRLWG